MLHADAASFARNDLRKRGHETLEQVHVFIINILNVIHAKVALSLPIDEMFLFFCHKIQFRKEYLQPESLDLDLRKDHLAVLVVEEQIHHLMQENDLHPVLVDLE